MPRTVKIAIIGSGLAGLTAAYLLSGSAVEGDVVFEVHIFEKSSVLGMDSSSISLPNPGKEHDWRVDVPMRSFQGGYYTQLISLYKHLGISFRKTDFTYSFSFLTPASEQESRKICASMIYNGASGTAGVSMPSKMQEAYLRKGCCGFAIRAAARARSYGLFLLFAVQILLLYIRILLLSIPILRPSRIEKMTFRTWAERTIPRGFIARWTMFDFAWVEFTRHVLIPLFSAVCTAPEEVIQDHPVEEFLDYIWLTLGYHHYVALNGVRDVVSKLTSSVRYIHLSSPISRIQIDPDDPALASVHCTLAHGVQVHPGFHHIIFATQANSAIPLLESLASSLPAQKTRRRAIEEQIDCLRQFTYCRTTVVNHTDPSLLPDNVGDRRDLNLISVDMGGSLPPYADDDKTLALPPTYTMATHIIPRPRGFPTHLPSIFQTTNPIVEPRESRILSVAKLERAVLTIPAKQALKGLNVEYGRKWWQAAGQGKSKLGRLQGAGRLQSSQTFGIWITGSFAYSGIPLLEGCVVSARNVVEQGIWNSEGCRGRVPW